jgi:hypothetical protein
VHERLGLQRRTSRGRQPKLSVELLGLTPFGIGRGVLERSKPRSEWTVLGNNGGSSYN